MNNLTNRNPGLLVPIGNGSPGYLCYVIVSIKGIGKNRED